MAFGMHFVLIWCVFCCVGGSLFNLYTDAVVAIVLWLMVVDCVEVVMFYVRPEVTKFIRDLDTII